MPVRPPVIDTPSGCHRPWIADTNLLASPRAPAGMEWIITGSSPVPEQIRPEVRTGTTDLDQDDLNLEGPITGVPVAEQVVTVLPGDCSCGP